MRSSRIAIWYPKHEPPFLDALATTHRRLGSDLMIETPPLRPEQEKIPDAILYRLTDAAYFPA